MRPACYIYSLLVLALFYLGAASAQAKPTQVAMADTASNVRLVGHLGGATYGVAVVGNRAYVGEGPSLAILDISNPAQPLFLGKTKPLPDIIRKVMVVSDRAYVAAGTAGLRVINVADPAAPIEVGFYDLPGQDFAKDVYAVGNTAYIAYDSDGMRIVNVTNPAAPTEVGNYTVAGANAEGIYVVGNRAYVAYGAKGLRLVNVTNLAAPVELGSYDPITDTYGVAVVDNRAYVAGGGLQIVNVTDPTAPTELGTYSGVGGAVDVQVVGNIAYLANSSNGMSIVNVADPTAPSELHIHPTPDYASDLAVADNIAYVTNSDAGLRVINVVVPTAPNEISFYDPLEAAQSVYVNGSMAYVADGGSGLRIVNVANPNAPRETAVYDTPFYAFDVHIASNIAYVADGYSLRLINVANPSTPSTTGAYTPIGFADIRDVYVVGNIAYVADGTNGVRIVNVADPTAPIEIGLYDTPGSVEDLYVIDTTVYIADANKGLRVVNASNPAAPSPITAVETLTATAGVFVVGGTVYVADSNAGLRLLQWTVASTLTEIGFYNLPGAQAVEVLGNHAYVADNSTLHVVNVATPSAPSAAGFYEITGQAMDVAVAGGIAYLAGGAGGLFLLKYPPCYLLTVSQRGAGALPTVNPTNSSGCNSSEYLPGASITLSANPAPNWQVAGWIGTKNDSSTSKNNIVEMPAIEHEASVIYTPICYALTLTHSGSGSDPSATPPNSPGCAAGQYIAGASITLTANPAAGHAVSGWNGTVNDANTATQNTLTMPGNLHTASVVYGRVCFGLSLTHSGSGSDPTVSAPQSNDCPAQTYRSGATITLTANPASGYTVGSWSGTANDSNTALTNTLVMPAADHSASVNYLPACYQLTLSHSGQGADPTATPGQSAGCPAGRYHFTESIALSATPAAGWQIGSWSGTSNNSATSVANSLVMPANDHTVSVNYAEPPLAGPGDSYETDGVCTRSRGITTDGSEVQEHSFHAVADTDWVHFTASSGQHYRIEVQVPVTSTADVNLEVYAQCEAAAFDRWNASFSPGARLDIIAPASGPIYLRLANQDANLAGNNVRYTVSVRNLGNEAGKRALILVAGRLTGGDRLQKNIHNVTNAVYKLFQANGYDETNIQYLATDSSLPGYDEALTRASLRAAITTWAKEQVGSDGVLNLYLMDHGSPDLFYLDELSNQRLTPDDLNGWLGELESAAPNVKVNVFIEACQSGSFITPPGSISKAGRVVITSSNAENDAKASKDGAYFSDHLLTWLRQGYNLAAAFDEASSVARAIFSLQRAMLDADGNGIPNEFGDSNTAAKRSFAYASSLGNEWPPHIFAAQAVNPVTDQKVRLRVDVRDDKSVNQVWAVVYEPGYTPPTTSQTLQPEVLPTVLFVRVDNDNHWEAEITGLNKAGTYQLLIHADDEQGLVARPVNLVVTTAASGQGGSVYLPLVRK